MDARLANQLAASVVGRLFADGEALAQLDGRRLVTQAEDDDAHGRMKVCTPLLTMAVNAAKQKPAIEK